MARRRRGSDNTVRIGDLTQVETGFNTIPEGRHTVEVESASIEQSRSGNDYIKFELAVTDVRGGGKLFHNCSLQPQALFNLKNLLQALGFSIPSKAFDLDLNELIGLECDVEVTHEVYEGKQRPRITEFYTADGAEADEDGFDIEAQLEEMVQEELAEIAINLGLSKAKVRKMDEDTLIDSILDFDDEEIEEAMDADEEDEEDEEEEELDYEDMSLKELKAEAKARGLKVTRRMKEDDIIEMLEEDDEE